MTESLHEARAKSHTLFKRDDFTYDEIRSGNVIAEAVMKHGQSICKVCGRTDEDTMTQYCQKRGRNG